MLIIVIYIICICVLCCMHVVYIVCIGVCDACAVRFQRISAQVDKFTIATSLAELYSNLFHSFFPTQILASMQQQAQGYEAGYDVILMDYVMPVMDGPTATEKIRCVDFFVL